MEKKAHRTVVKILCASMLSLILVGLNVSVASAQQVVWTRQFGTSDDDLAYRIAVCGSSVYVIGYTQGALPGQTHLGLEDAFLCKYDVFGNLKWVRQFGTSGEDTPYGVAVNGLAVYVVGSTTGAFPGYTNTGDNDAFVCKYDVYGNLKWIRQFGTSASDTASGGVAVNGLAVYVAGTTKSALPGQTSSGGQDGFLCKFDVCGNMEWIRQFGTKDDDGPWGLAVNDLAAYVVGYTRGAMPGQTHFGGFDAFVCKYDAYGNMKWTRQLGTIAEDHAYGVSVSWSGVYVAGYTGGAMLGQTHQGGMDAFVCKYDVYGNLKWIRQFGTNVDDEAWNVAVCGSSVYVIGSTWGVLPGQSSVGMRDAFVCRFDAYGNLKWVRQFGTTEWDIAEGLAIDGSAVYAAGFTRGAFPGQTYEGAFDAYVCKLAPP